MESKVSLSAGQEHSALATSKLSKMDELVNQSSIGRKMIRSRGLSIWTQVKSSVAHLRSPHQAGMLALTVHGRQQTARRAPSSGSSWVRDAVRVHVPQA